MFNRRVVSVILAAAPWLLILQGTASAENSFHIYPGSSPSRDSKLQLIGPGSGTGFTFRGRRWDIGTFGAAPYYGFGVTRYFDTYPGWGMAFDFSHYKMYAHSDRIAPAGGIWNRISGNAKTRMDGHAHHFETSQGVNILSLDGVYRWAKPAYLDGRLRPYVRAGLSYSLPYRGSALDPALHQSSDDYSGFGFHLQGGVQYRLSRQWGLFAGAKLSSGAAGIDITGYRNETSLRTLHVVGGANYDF